MNVDSQINIPQSYKIHLSSEWREKPTVKKGDWGELQVELWLLENNYTIYTPKYCNNPHPFDRLVESPNGKLFIGEVKTKPHRKHYPDTGFNKKHLWSYFQIWYKYNLDVFIYFVDTLQKRCYGNWLQEITKPRNIEHNGKILEYIRYERDGRTGQSLVYFPLVAMEPIFDIPNHNLKTLNTILNGYAEAGA